MIIHLFLPADSYSFHLIAGGLDIESQTEIIPLTCDLVKILTLVLNCFLLAECLFLLIVTKGKEQSRSSYISQSSIFQTGQRFSN